MSRILCVLIIVLAVFVSCTNAKKEEMLKLMHEWQGKEILFPPDLVFTGQNGDVIGLDSLNHTYKVFSYIDSIGCMSCKLKLSEWKKFMFTVDSLYPKTVSFQFVFQPHKISEMQLILKREKFSAPICIDKKGRFEELNKFPKNISFQTFLLDKDNKVVAIGNPVHNPKVKELYLKIILGDKTPQKEVKIQTTVMCSNTLIDMEKFDWHQEQKCTFTLTNTGNNPLVVTDIITSCGCTTVDYGKEPVRPGSSVELKVNYKADHPEHFNKTITVYCNAATSPIQLRIKGKAE